MVGYWAKQSQASPPCNDQLHPLNISTNKTRGGGLNMGFAGNGGEVGSSEGGGALLLANALLHTFFWEPP